LTVDEMRILTVKQPWAWAIIHRGKDVENRSRNLAGDYRGMVAIHAGASSLDPDAYAHPAMQRLEPAGRGAFRFGEILGLVDLVGVHESGEDGCGTGEGFGTVIPQCSEWAEGFSHHLVLANPHPLAKPLPYRGSLGLRRLDPATTAEILAAASLTA
jgi:hypothetical protein